MTIALRPAYLAIAGAFLAGMLVVAGAALALGGSGQDAQEPRQAVALVTATTAPPAPTQAPSPAASATSTPEPTTEPTAVPTLPPPVVSGAPANPAPTSGPQAFTTPLPAQPGSGYAFIGAVWADEDMPVPYCVNPANMPIDSAGEPLMNAETFASIVQGAFQTWQNIAGSYISFAYTGFCDADPFVRIDRVNTVGFGWLFSSAIGLASPAATHGEFLRQSSFGQIYEMDLVMDIRYAQSFDDESEYINRALPWVLLHEIGHFIGLDHTDDPCSIMQPVIVDAAPQLCEVDHAGARALYPE